MNRRAVLLAAAALLATPAFAAAAPAPPSEMVSAEDARFDFQAMYDGLRQAHIDLYAHTPNGVLDTAFRRDLAAIDRTLTRFELQKRLQLFSARARMGHTRVDYLLPAWAAYRKAGGKGLPLKVRIVGGRFFVAENRSGVAAVSPGDELLSLNGAPIAGWLKRTGRHVSAETDAMTWSLLEYDFAPLLWLELGPVERFELETRTAHGRRVRTVIPALSAEAEIKPAIKPPFDPMTREARVLAGGVAYLKPGPFYNMEAATPAEAWDARAFAAFIDGTFAKFSQAKAERLLIDLRGNPGGDRAFSDLMIAWFANRPFRFFSSFKVRVSPQAIAANQARLDADAAAAGEVSRQFAALYASARPGEVVDFPLALTPPRAGDRFGGKVYVLIDRQSYSNAVNVAALVQDYGFGTILGEATADMATAHGAMETFKLPRTGITVGFPKALIVRPNGDRRAHGVRPDVPIPAPVVAGREDEVLARALEVVRKGG